MNFSPKKATWLMIFSILCGLAVYSLVLLTVSIVMPYPEFLARETAWGTGDISIMIFGQAGAFILAIPVAAAIFSGINGFMLAASRLLLAMGRASAVPYWFEQVDSKHGTPKNALIFVFIVVFLSPLVGRPFLVWLLDTMAISISVSYVCVCATAYRLAKKHPELVSMPFAKSIAVIGGLLSTGGIILLVTPGAPGSISIQSTMLCICWIIIGYLFYRSRVADNAQLTIEEKKAMILGDIDAPILFEEKKK